MSQAKLVATSILSIFITALLFVIVSFKSVPVHSFDRPSESPTVGISEKVINTASQKEFGREYYMSEKGEQILQNELIKPLQKVLKIKNTTKMFSRCPSGLGFIVLQNPESQQEYFQGLIENFVGCEGKEICTFRMNASETSLEVLDTQREQYVSARQWLQAYTKVQHVQAN